MKSFSKTLSTPKSNNINVSINELNLNNITVKAKGKNHNNDKTKKNNILTTDLIPSVHQ